MAPNLEALLAALRGEEAPAAPGWTPEDALTPLRQRVDELEKRLVDLSAPPAEPEPPAPPNETGMFLQTRVELLESKLELAQREALRATLLLNERDEAQRKAQREVEDLFHAIREQQRAAGYDAALREKVKELEQKLALAELNAVPAQDVLRALDGEEGRKELKARIQAKLASGLPTPVEITAEQTPTWALVLGRVSDLERRLQEAEAEKEKERQTRLHWENSMLLTLKQMRGQWQKAGGPELLVEATLEGLIDTLRQRDDIQGEMSRVVSSLRDEPLDSAERPALHKKLEELRAAMDSVQEKLDQQMSVVSAWTGRNAP